MPAGPGEAFMPLRSPIAPPPGLAAATCWPAGGAGGPLERRSSDSCLCLAAASCTPWGPPPTPVCSWPRSPPLGKPSSELMSSSGRSCSRSNSELKSAGRETGETSVREMRADGGCRLHGQSHQPSGFWRFDATALTSYEIKSCWVGIELCIKKNGTWRRSAKTNNFV